MAPGQIAEELFCLDPDRDERAPQLCAETLLTLAENSYKAPAEPTALKSPKRQRFAVRSLALEVNFLGGHDKGRAGDDKTTPSDYGESLAKGEQILGSAQLGLAQMTLQGLVDPDTQRGQRGAWLMRPFHESLLWYDARRPSPNSPEFSVRKVYMRGSGITLARLLLDPADPDAAELGKRAVDAIREALTAASPLGEISDKLESPRFGNSYPKEATLEQDELLAWEKGRDPRVAGLAARLCRHAEGVMHQGGASGPARLWQLRTVLALDLAIHALQTAWGVTQTQEDDRFLLLSFGGVPRNADPVRQRSEESYRRARIRLSEATVRTLARRMRELRESDEHVDWVAEFEPRSGLSNSDEESISTQLSKLRGPIDQDTYLRLARASVEKANYNRAEDGFRVLLQSVGLLAGTRYPYLTATPDLLAALVGAMSSRMPMPSREFFSAVRQEWGFTINQESAADTTLSAQLDGAGLERNARRAEQLMSDAGLALGLSDRTTMVGERAARTHP